MPINYNNGKIYMIIAPNLKKHYIGSTTQPLSKRMIAHRSKYNRRDRTDYTSAFQVLEDEDAYITLLENYPCNDKRELEIREGYFQSTMDCVNINQAGRTPSQRYQDNKPQILECRKIHYRANRPRILNYKKRYYRLNRPAILVKRKRYREAKKYDLGLDLLFNE